MIEGRAATENDVNRCDAIFSTGGRSKPFATPGLPALAILTSPDGRKERVVVVQIEAPDNNLPIMVGYVLPDGGNGVGTLPEFEILEYAR